MPRRRQPPGHNTSTGLERVLEKFKLLRGLDGEESLEIKNLKVSTDIKGAKYVLVIDGQGAPGMQHPIGVDGYVKCIICTERANNRLICTECENAVHFIRSLSSRFNMNQTTEFFEQVGKLDNTGLLDVLKLVTVEWLREWMQKQVDELDEPVVQDLAGTFYKGENLPDPPVLLEDE